MVAKSSPCLPAIYLAAEVVNLANLARRNADDGVRGATRVAEFRNYCVAYDGKTAAWANCWQGSIAGAREGSLTIWLG
jgi:hypothetical protein